MLFISFNVNIRFVNKYPCKTLKYILFKNTEKQTIFFNQLGVSEGIDFTKNIQGDGVFFLHPSFRIQHIVKHRGELQIFLERNTM